MNQCLFSFRVFCRPFSSFLFLSLLIQHCLDHHECHSDLVANPRPARFFSCTLTHTHSHHIDTSSCTCLFPSIRPPTSMDPDFFLHRAGSPSRPPSPPRALLPKHACKNTQRTCGRLLSFCSSTASRIPQTLFVIFLRATQGADAKKHQSIKSPPSRRLSYYVILSTLDVRFDVCSVLQDFFFPYLTNNSTLATTTANGYRRAVTVFFRNRGPPSKKR